MFSPYLAQGTIWTRSVASMPLASNSAAMANWMWTLSPTPYRDENGTSSGAFGGKTSFNTSAFGTQPIAAYIVDSTDPRCRFQYVDAVSVPGVPTNIGDGMMKGPIPWPSGATPA